MIEEAKQLASATVLKIDAVKALQQRWQHESQAVALDRKLAQKLWDAFRQPLDEAFQRKTQDRSQQTQALSAHDQAVLDASKALEIAIAEGDVAVIRQAMQHLSQVVTAQPIKVEPSDAKPIVEEAPMPAMEEPVEAEAKPPAPPKKVVAVRGDDVLVVDAKTGQRKDSHLWQVLLYLLMWRKIRPDLAQAQVRGEVQYMDGCLDVPADAVTKDVSDRIYGLLRTLGRQLPPEAVPSPNECHYCSIPASECSARVDAPVLSAATEDF
jgi:hypothetical protein